MNTFCVLGENCVVYDRRTNTPGLTVSRALCFGCDNHYANVLSMLRLDFVDLSQIVSRRQVFSDTKISRPKPSSTPPLDLHVLTLRDDIVVALKVWDTHVRAELRAPGIPAGVRDGFAVDVMVTYLSPRLDEMARLDARPGLHDGSDGELSDATGADGLLRFDQVHRRARTAVGLAERVVKLPGFCPTCQVAAMRREEAGEKVWCAACKSALAYDAYVDHMKFVRVKLDPQVVTPERPER